MFLMNISKRQRKCEVVFTKFKITTYNDKNQTNVEEIKIYTLDDLIDQFKRIRDEGIVGAFELVPENKGEHKLIKLMENVKQH